MHLHTYMYMKEQKLDSDKVIHMKHQVLFSQKNRLLSSAVFYGALTVNCNHICEEIHMLRCLTTEF